MWQCANLGVMRQEVIVLTGATETMRIPDHKLARSDMIDQA